MGLPVAVLSGCRSSGSRTRGAARCLPGKGREGDGLLPMSCSVRSELPSPPGAPGREMLQPFMGTGHVGLLFHILCCHMLAQTPARVRYTHTRTHGVDISSSHSLPTSSFSSSISCSRSLRYPVHERARSPTCTHHLYERHAPHTHRHSHTHSCTHMPK